MSEIQSTINALRERASRARSDAFLFDEAATTIEQLASIAGGIEAPSTGTTIDTPPTPTNNTLLVGCTMGLETLDHLNKPGSYGAVPFDDVHDPAVIRFFYHMDKSTPDACAPKDMDKPFRVFIGDNQDDYEKHEKKMFWRLQALRKRFPNTTIIVCTEIAEKPEGGLADFPNRNWKKDHWRDASQVIEWMDKFIIEAYAALQGNFIWQLSSEPWDIDWQYFHRTILEEIIGLDRQGAQLPPLMTPAFPIGQGGDNEHGTNKWWGRSFEEFMPADLRDAYSYVSFHNYPLTESNEWDIDLEEWEDKLILFDAALRALGMSEIKTACTEFGYDMNQGSTSRFMLGDMIDKLIKSSFSLATIYAYRTQGGAHFTNCYLQKRDGTHVDAYDLVTPALRPA